MTVLVTNAEGVDAPGLRALVAALRPIAEPVVVAPDCSERDWVTAGMRIHTRNPIRVDELPDWDGVPVFLCRGTPVDCVNAGAYALCRSYPEMVVAGIGDGYTIGPRVLSSAAVCAALQGPLLQHRPVPGVTVSVGSCKDTPERFEVAASVARDVIELCMNRKLIPEGVALNINVPALPRHRMSRVEITELGDHIYKPYPEGPLDLGEGGHSYWLRLEQEAASRRAGTDIAALEEGRVSITPLTHRLTASEEALEAFRRSPLGRLLTAAPSAAPPGGEGDVGPGP